MKTDPRMERAALEAERLYGDIMHREAPEPDPVKHPRLSMEQRAAQFLPFSALKGYDEAVDEKARMTIEKPELDEDKRQELDRTIAVLLNSRDIEAVITFFRKDERKEGGELCTVKGVVRKTDPIRGILTLSDGRQIAVEDIVAIDIP